MELQITSNALNEAAKLQLKGNRVERAARKATREATTSLYKEARKQVNVIYARPIPKGKGRRVGTFKSGKRKGQAKRAKGKPLWKRKGTLRRGEAMSFPDAFTGMIGNDTPYAQARHELNKPGAGGVTRHDPWRRKTLDSYAGRMAGEVFDNTFAIELSK